MSDIWTYRYECKGLQSWIVAGGKLREMVAASDLIAGLGHVRDSHAAAIGLTVHPELSAALGTDGYRVLSDAAGGCTMCFGSRLALQKFASSWPLRLERAAPGLTMVQSWASGDDAPVLERLRLGLGAVRNRVFPRLPQAGPLVERTTRTGAAAVKREHGRLIDAASAAKLAHRKQSADAADLATRFGVLPAERTIDGQDGCIDFPEGLVALVHADGNGIGRWLAGAQLDAAKFRTFSEALKEATQRAAAAATEAIRAAGAVYGRERNVLPMRPLVLGGDDVTLLISARWALPWTQRFLEKFEEHTGGLSIQADIASPGFTAAAGIVFCKRNWPLAQAHALAEELCSSAKRRLKAGADTSGASGLLFHRVLGGDASDWDAIVAGELGRGLLVGGPYVVGSRSVKGLPKLDQLAAIADVLASKAVPNSAARRMVDVLVVDPERSEQAWNRVRAVLGDRGSEVANQIENKLEQAGLDLQTALWAGRQGTEQATPLRDAIVWNRLQRGPKASQEGR